MSEDPDLLLSAWRARVEEALEGALDPLGMDFLAPPPARLAEAMRYAVMAGGKRLRPLLVLASGHALGGKTGVLLPAAVAVELIHTYSLVHDDLPAMDDDDLRRGRPTCHRVFGEALAILAGDALQARAFETLTGGCLPGEVIAAQVEALSRASGPVGMVGGQVLDLEAEGRVPTLEMVQAIHRAKTGALVAACFNLGALAARGPGEEAVRLESLGRKVGLAFQIVDDILDETSSAEELGKTPGKDLKTGKATWTAVVGLEVARAQAGALAREVHDDLLAWGPPAEPLRRLVQRVVDRRS